MKKFFGILLIVIGSIWALFSLFAFNADDGVAIFASLFVIGMGVAVVLLGIKLTKGNKQNQNQGANSQNQYTPPQPQNTNDKAAPLEQQNTSIKDIRELTAQKLDTINTVEGRSTSAELAKALYMLNDPKLPFSFEGCSEKGIDMTGHWRLADTDYLGMLNLNKHNLQAKFDVLMKFDELNHVLRCKDKMYRKESSFGLGGMGMEMSTFSGKSKSVQREITFGRRKDGSIGKVVDINLDTTILQNAIKVVAEKYGWEVKRVAGRL